MSVGRTLRTTVRIAHAEPRPGDLGNGIFITHGYLVVLADDTGHRALPVWFAGHPGGTSLSQLLGQATDDLVTVGAPEELTARLLGAAAASVTGVDIDLAAAGQVAKSPGAARVSQHRGRARRPAAAHGRGQRDHRGPRRAGPPGVRGPDRAHRSRRNPAGHGATGRGPRRRDHDGRADPGRRPGPGPAGGIGSRWRPTGAGPARAYRPQYEPRNLAFRDGLDGWLFDGSFSKHASESHWHDYSCVAEHGTAALSSAVPRPEGFALLRQAVFADDYRGATVTFRGEFRAADAPGRAGLFLRVNAGPDVRGPLTYGAALTSTDRNIVATAGERAWTHHEVTARVPDGADALVFGVFLEGRGRIELRHAELVRRPLS